VPEPTSERLATKLRGGTSLAADADLEPIDWERQTSFEITGYVDHSPDRNALAIPLPWENAWHRPPTDEQLRASLRAALERVIEQTGDLRLTTGMVDQVVKAMPSPYRELALQMLADLAAELDDEGRKQ
jgi:hypothetical protein